MTIRKGQPWGKTMSLPEDALIASTDSELADHVSESYPAADIFDAAVTLSASEIVLGVVGGDLHRTLGSPTHTPEELRNGAGVGFPIDLGVVRFTVSGEAGEGHHYGLFAAHLIATSRSSRSLWAGRTVIAMNAAFRGAENLAPRGHPNDGRLDLIDGQLAPLDRRRAHKRTYAGSHVPHPNLEETRVRDISISNETEFYVELDSSSRIRARHFQIRCISDAVTVIV